MYRISKYGHSSAVSVVFVVALQRVVGWQQIFLLLFADSSW